MITYSNLLLTTALTQATIILRKFAEQADFVEQLQVAFGDSFNLNIALGIRSQWRSGNFDFLPKIEVLSNGELGTANGAYAAILDEILISADFLARQQGNTNSIAELLLEEIGHKLDRLLNGNVDSPGDEGAIFRLLATGHTLSAQTLAGLRAEDDHAVIIVDGRSISIEQQDFFGDAGNNTLIGTSGNDYFIPGTGADTIDGGAGIDRLVINNFFDGDTNITYTNTNTGTITGGSNDGTKFKNIESVDLITSFGNDVINISAATGDSLIQSGNGNDTVTGGSGNDVLYTGDGNDKVNGGGGNDTIDMGAGADTIDGGAGIDRLSIDAYEPSNTTATNIKYTNTNTGTITGGPKDGTKFKNIESFFINTGSLNDVINISAATADSTINAGEGNDVVTGGAGNDLLYTGSGDNTINGGDGNDTIRAENGSNTANGGDGNDNIFITGNGNQNVNGDAGNDTINTGDGNDTVSGGAGDDSIVARNGNNNIDGGAGNDYISVGTGNDTVTGGGGDDHIDVGTGTDTVDGGGGNDILSIGFNGGDTDTTTMTYTNANAGTITGGSNNGTKFKNIESVNFTTGSGNDVINISAATADSTINAGDGNNTVTGGKGNDFINGGVGNDFISSSKGNDIINVGAGTDTVDGGDGNDFLSIGFNGGDTDNTTITYTNVNAGTITGGSNNGTKFKNIESVNFTTGSGNDVINISAATGDSTISAGEGDNTVTGGEGNDNIGSGAGNDTISGGKGKDTISTGTGVDTVDGGAGIDRLFIINNGDVDNTTITYTNTSTGTITGGSNNGTKFKNIESANFFTGAGNDVINISATTSDNYIDTGDGNDTVTSGAGNDTIVTGTGRDTVDGGGGNDFLVIDSNYGDTDNTTITYTNVNTGTITGGFNNGTNFKNIELVAITTGSGDDVINIAAATGESSISAGEGNNTVTGGAGNDNISAGDGNNTVIGGAGDDFLSTGNGTNTLSGGAGNDSIFTGTGDDIIDGGAGNDTIYAGAGNNTISGGNDDDIYDINARIDIGTTTINETTTGGVDTLDFSRSDTPVNVDLSLTTIQAVAPNLQLVIPVISLENVTGTIGNDTLTGNSLNNTLIGRAGDDLLTGGAGRDRFVFSGDYNPFGQTDSITAQLGKDTITDFTTRTDKIVLSKANFSAITNDIGTAIGANFAIVADDNAASLSTLSAAIIYSQSSGNLFYNQDGALAGLGRDGGNFATLTGLPTLAAGDFSLIA